MPHVSEFGFLREILQNWPAPFPSAAVMEARQGFSGALVYRLRVAGQEFAARGWPAEGLPRVRLEGLHHFLCYLHERGLKQISVPIAALDGTTLVEAFGRWWQLEPWMPGRANFAESPTPDKLSSVMQLLGRLHRLAERYEPEQESAVWFAVQSAAPSPGVIERVQLIERWSDTDPQTLRRLMNKSRLPDAILDRLREVLTGFHRHARVIQAELQALLGISFHLHPCVRDLWHDHVLFTDEAVTGLIDFGACRSENAMIDLSRLLVSLFPDDTPSRQTAIGLYEITRPILPEEHRLLAAFDRSQRLLAGMTWIERLLIDAEVPSAIDRVSDRLEAVLTGMRPLARILP